MIESPQRRPVAANAYEAALATSLQDPASFWSNIALDIKWYEQWNRVLDDTTPPFYRWFAGGTINTCYNAVDRHVDEGLGNRIALIHDSPVSRTIRSMTYRELRDQVSRFAGVLRNLGVESGDRVVIHMPMIPEGVIAMLSAARLGAVHCVVFGGTPSEALAVQIDQIRPKVVVSASCGFEYDNIIDYMPTLMGAISRLQNNPTNA